MPEAKLTAITWITEQPVHNGNSPVCGHWKATAHHTSIAAQPSLFAEQCRLDMRTPHRYHCRESAEGKRANYSTVSGRERERPRAEVSPATPAPWRTPTRAALAAALPFLNRPTTAALPPCLKFSVKRLVTLL